MTNHECTFHPILKARDQDGNLLGEIVKCNECGQEKEINHVVFPQSSEGTPAPVPGTGGV